jgi:PBP1b-binding outer membrane lipoprotein LpoB
MKISVYGIIAAAALLAAGCAHQTAQGGSSGAALEGYSQGQASSDSESGIQDYRQVLSDPGPF